MLALDVMGGDYAPSETIRGAIAAARKGLAIQLYGDQVQIKRWLSQFCLKWEKLPLQIIHCSSVVEMDDEPALAMKNEDSSLLQAIRAVKDNKAKAIVSAGNTGACLVGGMFIIGKIGSIIRPAIGEFLPTRNGSVFCIDLGANVDCKLEHLKQFALMGDAYVRLKKQIKHPRIGLLSNGAERGKGTRLIIEAYEALQKMPINFIGNCEPDAVLTGTVDVLVCEGFSGNIMLKTCEAMARVVPYWIGQETKKTFLGKCFSVALPRIFKNTKKAVHGQKGGALLLGLAKPVIIAHGASDAAAIENALLFAHQMVSSEFLIKFNNELAHLLQEISGESNTQNSITV